MQELHKRKEEEQRLLAGQAVPGAPLAFPPAIPPLPETRSLDELLSFIEDGGGPDAKLGDLPNGGGTKAPPARKKKPKAAKRDPAVAAAPPEQVPILRLLPERQHCMAIGIAMLRATMGLGTTQLVEVVQYRYELHP